jgi:hypothetical protein
VDILGQGNADVLLLTSGQEGQIILDSLGQVRLDAFDASGILEYRFGPHQAWYWKPSYGGTGGPFGDGYFPIPHSGQIAAMILDDTHTQQAAYDGGNEILMDLIEGSVDFTPFFTNGVLYKYPDDDGDLIMDAIHPENVNQFSPLTHEPLNFGIAVSGHTDLNSSHAFASNSYLNQTYAISKLGSNFLYIRGSGLWSGAGTELDNISVSANPAWLWLGTSGIPNKTNVQMTCLITNAEEFHIHAFEGGIRLHSQEFITLDANTGQMTVKSSTSTTRIESPTRVQLQGTGGSAVIDMDAVQLAADFTGAAALQANTTLNLTGVTSATLASAGDVSLVSTGADVNLISEAAVNISAGPGDNDSGDDVNIVAGHQTIMSAFQASGRLQYQFGPYEAWHVSPSHTSDFFPIAHSGQVTQMIEEEVGSTIQSTTSTYNNVGALPTVITINHNFGTEAISVIVKDTNTDRIIIPNDINITSTNQVIVTMNTSLTGRITVFGTGP